MSKSKEVLKVFPDAGNAPWLWSFGARAFAISGAPGLGLSLELQTDAAEWAIYFESNQSVLLGIQEKKDDFSFDWDEFHAKGLSIAKRLQEETGGLFEIYYVKPYEDPNHEINEETLIENNLDSTKHLTSDWYNGHVSIAFSKPSNGWVQMVIMHDTYLQNHIIHLSEVFDPFPELVELVNNIAQGNCKQSITIDEEGSGSYIYINPYDDNWFVATKVDIEDTVFDEMAREYVLDEDAKLPEDINIFYWVYPYTCSIAIRDFSMFIPRGTFNEPAIFQTLKYYPIAYLFCNKPQYAHLDTLSHFRGCGLDEEIGVPINLKRTEPPYWPESPSDEDNNIFFGGQSAMNAIHARPRNSA